MRYVIMLETKYLAPTDHRGARIRITRTDGGIIPGTDDKRSVTVPYDYSAHNPHTSAVAPYVGNSTVYSGTKTGYIFEIE